ncbi:Lrp/AsnC family transcriptional regulator [Nonomuraea jabiensis]|uniref:Lrp/AsnC family transcriptional regulator n=1 Tax=Nonomuraea jabiensis TaxID=882448 RepID=UPI00161627E4|nr:Lrp/AsnC ligand binding domain-containing protein [Nonomuraea jabiensis]
MSTPGGRRRRALPCVRRGRAGRRGSPRSRIAPHKAGLGTSAYVSLTIEQNSWRAVSARLRETPYVENFALVGGDYDVLALVRTPDNATLRHVVLELIQDIPGIRATRTWLVFEEARGAGAG